MQKGYITFHQHIQLIILFILGSSMLFGINSIAKQDSWIALLLALLLILPVVLIYARILKLFPETDIFSIIDQVFGKIVSKVITALLTWYAIHLCALVLRNFTEYVNIIAMPETPSVVIMVLFLLVTIYLAKSKPKTLGEWAIISSVIVFLSITATIVLAVKDMDFKNLLPIMPDGPKNIVIGAGQIFTFPFAESIAFLSIGNTIKKEDSNYKIYVYGILFSTLIMLLVIIRNIITLGEPMISSSYFPSFNMARTIHIGDFLTRIEGTISVNLVLSGITKITVCLICAAKGISSLFHIEKFEHMISPLALLIMSISTILYKNTIEMFNFLKYYSIYAIPFQVIIPIIIWIAAERYKKKNHTVYKSQNTAT